MSDAAIVDKRDQVLAGILLSTGAYLLFSMQDASIKLLVTAMTVWQILFFRSVTIFIACTLIGGPKLLVEAARSSIVNAMILRSFLILAAWLCYYTAARSLPLAELTTIYFGAPVVITVLSIFMLGETVTPIRWAAVLLGFAGVFVACGPAALGLSVPVLLVLAATLFWSLAMISMRMIALRERTMIQLVLNNAFYLVMAGAPMLFFWQTPTWTEFMLLVGAGVIGGGGQFLLFEGIKRASASAIAPMEYTSLVWAFILGYLIWGDVPRREVIFGAALIFAAGLLIIVSERFRRQA